MPRPIASLPCSIASSRRSLENQALIFDLDGTLVDNMVWHAQAFDAFATRHGLPRVTHEMRRRIDGKRNSEIFPILFERELSREDIRAFEVEKESAYREALAIDDQSADVRFGLGSMLRSCGRLDEAVRLAESSLEIGSEPPAQRPLVLGWVHAHGETREA